MAKKKKKVKWEVSQETDKDIETFLWERSCELCGRRNAGKGGKDMPPHCVSCIRGNNSPEFKLAAKFKKKE